MGSSSRFAFNCRYFFGLVTCITIIGAKCCGAMSLSFDRNEIDLLLSNQQYKFYLEAVAEQSLYAAVVDILTFKIRNSIVLLLFVLYLLFARTVRAWSAPLNFILAAFVFAVHSRSMLSTRLGAAT